MGNTERTEMAGNTSFELETRDTQLLPDNELGEIVVVQKNGLDGGRFPLLTGQDEWWIGRSPLSDICIKKTEVKDHHCCLQVVREEKSHKIMIVPFGPVCINGTAIATQPRQSAPKVGLDGRPSILVTSSKR